MSLYIRHSWAPLLRIPWVIAVHTLSAVYLSKSHFSFSLKERGFIVNDGLVHGDPLTVVCQKMRSALPSKFPA